jgi:acyl-coenzyme A thioesterase PaaI-like protein
LSSGTRLFSEVAQVTPAGPGRFEATVDPQWTIADKPNGGYLLALLGRAARSVSAHPHPIAASAHYLRSPVPGPVSIEAQLTRAGRSVSQVRATMSQDGAPCVDALVTTARLDPAAEPAWDRGLPGSGQLAYEQCVPLTPRTPDGGRAAILEQISVRLEPGSSGFMTGAPSGRGELRGWLALPGGEAFDPTALLFAVDAFPPATFEIEASGWVPTLELTAYVRAIPEPGPLRVLQQARLVDGQRVDESCFVWDVGGRLVVQGTQLAGIRLGSGYDGLDH